MKGDDRREEYLPGDPGSLPYFVCLFILGDLSCWEESFTSCASEMLGQEMVFVVGGADGFGENLLSYRPRALIHQHRPEGRTHIFFGVYKKQQTEQAWIKTC